MQKIELINSLKKKRERKEILDTIGNKLEASAHRDTKMLSTYDVLPAIVKPAGE